MLNIRDTKIQTAAPAPLLCIMLDICSAFSLTLFVNVRQARF